MQFSTRQKVYGTLGVDAVDIALTVVRTHLGPGPQRRPRRVEAIVGDVNTKKATTINVACLTALPVSWPAPMSCGKQELPTPMTAVSKNTSQVMLIERPLTVRVTWGHAGRQTLKSVDDASAPSRPSRLNVTRCSLAVSRSADIGDHRERRRGTRTSASLA